MWLRIVVILWISLNDSYVFATFEEYSIFEDDDIYGRPVTNSNHSDHQEWVIFPGTKWCGPGDIAKDYNDLGTYRETDKCCREHDNCDELILPSRSRHGLENPDRFTRLQCDCEQKFINCLKTANDMISWTIGKLYYNSRGTCYKKDFPVIECSAFQKGVVTRRKRCIKYKMNRESPQEWQWFDMPFFTEQ